jgi:hypothetical protein
LGLAVSLFLLPFYYQVPVLSPCRYLSLYTVLHIFLSNQNSVCNSYSKIDNDIQNTSYKRPQRMVTCRPRLTVFTLNKHTNWPINRPISAAVVPQTNKLTNTFCTKIYERITQPKLATQFATCRTYSGCENCGLHVFTIQLHRLSRNIPADSRCFIPETP